MKKKILIIILIILLTGGAFFVGWQVGLNTEESKTKTIITEETVSKHDIKKTLTSSGQVSAKTTEKLELTTTKYFKAMCVEDDDTVLGGENILEYTNGTYLTAPYDLVIENISVPDTESKCTSSNYVEVSNLTTLQTTISISENEIGELKKGQEVEIIDCKPNQDYIINYIKEQFNKYNKNISLDNCKKLNEYCLGDLNRINLEIKKISDYLISKVEVLDSDIDKLVFKDTELKVFDLTNALGVKDGNKALKILYDMLQANEAPIKILALITGTFRRMMFAKINKGSNAELANALNCKEFAIVKAKESANKYSATQLKNILNLLLEADYNIKSGQMSQENVLYYLICKIVN